MINHFVKRVPVFDARQSGLPSHALERRAGARALRQACLAWLPCGGLLAWLCDPIARWWLRRSGSPYLAEIAAIDRTVGKPGVWLLHSAYAFACTGLADDGPDGPVLRRTLDWPFPGLGSLAEIVRQCGSAGQFLNVTWPGFAGVLTAVAPGRFAASINQAPMRRRTTTGRLRWLDYALNALGALPSRGRPPPEHCLRMAFEQCADFDDACRFLSTVAVARPVLFLVTGCKPGQRILIERAGDRSSVHRDHTVAANAWRDQLDGSPLDGWEPRVCGEGPPLENNRGRVEAIARFAARHPSGLQWAQPPVVNSFTRLVVELNAASGELIVAGWEAGGRVTAVTVV